MTSQDGPGGLWLNMAQRGMPRRDQKEISSLIQSFLLQFVLYLEIHVYTGISRHEAMHKMLPRAWKLLVSVTLPTML